ncbi:DUF1449 family protein [Gallaecimonas kandeliae]|uniref:OB-fold-containig protein n=1 Tax=Gallaecimonas kandeliae TaxID=3029055 RepID=UPI002649F2E3|nr:OB-fold-containig protein [Gallaecimonas kandeliae]WKE65952.1 DUF1449 family protein [Gallaecimonas kandeliae]
MWDFFLANANLPFSLAFTLLCALGLIQVLGLVLGFSAGEAMDSSLPDLDIDDPGILSQAFGWLCFGRLPFLIWLMLWLLLFALLGWGLQWLALDLRGAYLPRILSGLGALLLSLPLQRSLGQALARVLPNSESSAVSQQELIGLVGEIVLGSASRSQAAEVAVVDKQGLKHYVMAKPYDDLLLEQGEQVLLFDLEDGIYLVSPYPG